ncbi:hypothetical protein [uncultured Pseudokineococcus sp.]|uniref:hypothetical protein n=1 Tax=uncultured Pseudokineococcus sp. TaxID=1642928 RepID=UPI00261628E5|nr:hypothetical protein [uncultured Pseudokineococcus sp.]
MKTALRAALALGAAAAVLAPALPASALGPDEIYVQGLNTEVSPARVPYSYSVYTGDFPLFCDIGGTTDRPAVWNGGEWLLPDGGFARFGRATDVPLCGDWDGDGDDELGVQRGRTFFLGSEAVTGGGSVTSFAFGSPGDVPLVGDWDGDGVDEVAVKRGNRYYFASENAPGGGRVTSSVFGRASDMPVAGNFEVEPDADYDGLALRRGRTFFVSDDRVGGSVSSTYSFVLGRPGDLALPQAVPGGGGPDSLALLRPVG